MVSGDGPDTAAAWVRQGLDIFGLVNGEECRCGFSAINRTGNGTGPAEVVHVLGPQRPAWGARDGGLISTGERFFKQFSMFLAMNVPVDLRKTYLQRLKTIPK